MKLSIITATYNAESEIGNLAASLARQSFRDFEWIVQDGASSDRTLEVLRTYTGANPVVESRKDSGIYDAFNTALARASGEYVLFMGADDVLAADETLSEVFQSLTTSASQPDLVVGSVRYPSGEVFYSSLSSRTLVLNTIHHQGVMYRRSLFANFEYDSSSPVVADYELNLICYLTRKPVLDSGVVFAVCGDDGVSRTSRERDLYRDLHRLRSKHISSVMSAAYFSVGLVNVARRKWQRRMTR